MSGDPRRHSREILDGPERAPARAYLKGIGFDEEALGRPIIGVAKELEKARIDVRPVGESLKLPVKLNAAVLAHARLRPVH